MSKALAIAVGVIVLLAAVPLLYLDRLAHGALEEGATETFGTKTTLGSVSLGLLSGRVGLGDLRVRNPEGWQEDHFFTIGDGRFGVGLRDLLADEVVVPELVLEEVALSLERSPTQSNYGTVLAHMQKGPPPPPDAEPRRFRVREVRILDVRADLRLDGPSIADEHLEVRIPEIVLRDVGSESEGGVLVSQVWSTVLRAVLSAVVREGGGAAAFVTRDLAGGLARVGRVPVQILGDVTRGGAEVGQGAAEQLGHAAGDALGEAGELGESAADAVEKGLGGLLGRDE